METDMQTIKKVLNSSVVLVEDEHGIERVLLGKGIGFGQKTGTRIEAAAADRVFVSLDGAEQRDFVQLLAHIPAEFVELTRAIVADAESEGLELDPHIYPALTDHVHFAVERMRRGLLVVNRLVWEMRTIYPVQFAVGARAVDAVNERLGVDLPAEEAANVAFHLANAARGKAGVDSLQVVQLIRSITTIVSNTTGIRVDRHDLNSSRFVTHLQFFAERFFAGRLLTNEDDFLFHNLTERYPRAVAAAELVRVFVHKQYNTALPNEEVAYLALHIARAMPE
jgi:beta-glucoside operon transcriptional antiterminator